MKEKVLIVTGGTIVDDLAKEYLLNKHYDVIIAVDGGLEVVDRWDQMPQYIVGDFDTVSPDIIKEYKQLVGTGKEAPRVMEYDSAKDATDTEIALRFALERNPSFIHILGATGSRLDHTLANLHLLRLGLEYGIPIEIIDQVNKIYMIDDNHTLNKNKLYGKYVSILPFTEMVTNITLKGFQYPLKDKTLSLGESIGVSNEVIDEVASIEIGQGILIIIESKDA